MSTMVDKPQIATKSQIAATEERKPKLKRYGFDVAGTLYHIDRYTPDQWEALKKKLGKVIEVEAANQGEAWKLYEEAKK
jgi:hypothetical protein